MTSKNILRVIVIAIAVVLGLWLTDMFGWQEPDTMDYLLAALAGLVGGAIGVWWRSHRRTR